MDVDKDAESENSDSDSDYCPENSFTKSRARKKLKATGTKKSKQDFSSNNCASTTIVLMKLPLELLVVIFQYIVQQYGPFLSLKKYGLVSKRWRLALLENKLWQFVDLNCKDSWLNINPALKWLCKFKQCAVKELRISSWVGYSKSSFEQLLQLCHQVKSVEFDNCLLKFDDIFKCLNLIEKLTITQCNIKNFNTLLLTSKGTLRCLSLTGVGGSLCQSLSKCDIPLVRLNTLQLDNFWSSKADSVSILQKMCPNLMHLELCFTYNYIGLRNLHGLNTFPNLKHLELTFCPHHSGLLCMLIAASPTLQSLILVSYTIQHCSVNFYDKLASIISPNLKDLDLFYCELDFGELLSKLFLSCHSLRRLTIANPKGHRVGDDIISTIVTSSCANSLKYLDLSGTNVTVDGVRMLLNSLNNLKHLDLVRCRYLPRGTKRLYNNSIDMDRLSKIVGD